MKQNEIIIIVGVGAVVVIIAILVIAGALNMDLQPTSQSEVIEFRGKIIDKNTSSKCLGYYMYIVENQEKYFEMDVPETLMKFWMQC